MVMDCDTPNEMHLKLRHDWDSIALGDRHASPVQSGSNTELVMGLALHMTRIP
jgi:hypothetical protein